MKGEVVSIWIFLTDLVNAITFIFLTINRPFFGKKADFFTNKPVNMQFIRHESLHISPHLFRGSVKVQLPCTATGNSERCV